MIKEKSAPRSGVKTASELPSLESTRSFEKRGLFEAVSAILPSLDKEGWTRPQEKSIRSFERRGRGGWFKHRLFEAVPTPPRLRANMGNLDAHSHPSSAEEGSSVSAQEKSIRSFERRELFEAIATIIFLIALTTPAFGQGVMYTGVWPNDVLVLDEATGAIKDRIKLKHGVALSLTRSQDRKKFYAVTGLMQTIEVVDIETKQVVDTVTFSEGNRITRFTRSLAVHPDGVTLFAPVRTTVKQIDRYDLEKAQLAKINIRDKKIEKLLELPREYGQGGLMRVSPDGKFLYVFSRDILIIDVAEFKLVDKILFDRPMYPGLGLFRFGTSFESHDEPNTLTFVYNSTDLMTNRGMMGIARFDLRDRSIDFYETGPNVGGSFAVSPDNKRAYIVRNQIGMDEFYVFDLEGKRLLKRQEYTGRPRTSIKVSSDGRRIYLHNAGHTIDYFNAETLQFEKRVELPGDFTTDLFVFPR